MPTNDSRGLRRQTVLLRSVALSLLACLPGAGQGRAQGPAGADPRPGFVGDAACMRCHTPQGQSYLHTAHHRTSGPADAATLGPTLHAAGERLSIVSPDPGGGLAALWFSMTREGDRFTETAVTGFPPNLQRRSEAMDIVTGSGKRGQTYLDWQGEQLFELPISFWTEGHRWINSPGYPDGTADFSRPIHPGCMECHATYLQPLSADAMTNRYVRSTFVPGISCETCHGPGAAHAAAQAAAQAGHAVAAVPAGDDIVNPAHLPRDRQVDLCALCHNGIQREPLAEAFSYRPGRPLADYFRPLEAAPVEHPDVHGNQVGLLERSRCFRSSPNMTCSTCHDTHAPELAAQQYSSRCLSCHRWQSCGEARSIGPRIVKNCIDCHMPIEATSVIVSTTAGQEVKATMRNHWIKVYPPTKTR